ncbi:hypothetical protein AJ80_02358 [Polytolypa hystricis UAMH7299]|uniref:Uncharacterized protein n=1 Tax=Polytolypa hystricis (strain UAMH7299) TaxID=1447883 RepID=A0A2B7YRR8_POLH7|nr:hypothetical protein AJ80_02358 [Polytolypa hystricis UAMH7299]
MAAAVEDKNNDPLSSTASLLDSLSACLSGAVTSLPSSNSHGEDAAAVTILPPTDGLSLLDTKNEIFLTYLQNLVFLLLIQLRNGTGPDKEESSLQAEVSKKLTELRIFLERGVRPLEAKLKYQVDKVLKAAEDAERNQKQPTAKKATKKPKRRNEEDSGSEDESGGESGSSEGSDSDADEAEIDELAYRPNIRAFAKDSKEKSKSKPDKNATPADGIYRPPKIKATALSETTPSRRAEREALRSAKSKIIDEFVSAEMSSAPMAEPSIGSTIRAGGRTVRTEKEREKELEKRTYEETNFVRLPAESKKERAKRGGNRPGGFGGEDWRSLGEGADRIERLTRRGKGSGGALERSRKRRPTDDGPRGDGVNVGDSFEKRRKKISGWK